MTRALVACCRSDRGETLIEFGLAALLYFTMIFGTIEFGLAVWQYNIISDLAQEGARWASVRGNMTSSAIQAASESDVRDYVRSRAVGFNVTVTTPLGAPSTRLPSQIIEVKVQGSYTPLTPLLPGATINLVSTAQMVMSR